MAFRDVIGHRTLLALLSRSIERQALPPSLMFAGPAGVGKRLVADAVSQAMNCLKPVRASDTSRRDGLDVDACGSCPACSRIARGVHPDVIVVEPEDTGAIKIEAIRGVIDRSGYRPFEGRRRVVIIDEADAMVHQAQGALLKTLEEPPSGSIFILVTSRPDALLITVRSRCPRLRFQPLAADEVAVALIRRGQGETEARAVAAAAEGSIGRAFEASAEELVEARKIAVHVLQQAAISDDPSRRLLSAKELLVNTGAGGALDRQQLTTHLRAMSSLLRDVALVATNADRRALANADVEPVLARLTAFHGDRGIQAFEAVDKALVALKSNAGVKTVADWVVLNL